MLDAERLGFIAGKLQILLSSQAVVRSTGEIAARQRVFANVLRATGENLDVMRRMNGKGAVWGL